MEDSELLTDLAMQDNIGARETVGMKLTLGQAHVRTDRMDIV